MRLEQGEGESNSQCDEKGTPGGAHGQGFVNYYNDYLSLRVRS